MKKKDLFNVLYTFLVVVVEALTYVYPGLVFQFFCRETNGCIERGSSAHSRQKINICEPSEEDRIETSLTKLCGSYFAFPSMQDVK